MSEIVVGVDGSEESKRALGWAADEARLRDARLVAVLAWTPAVVAPGPWPAIEVPMPDPDELETGMTAALSSAVDEVLGPERDIEVEQRVVRGSAAPMLVEAARDAELLVVGSRGHGGFAGLLLGSVSQQCAHHASCPVVIVRRPERGE